MNQESAIRLQKILAQAGVGSRRACEEIISAGRVKVNGAVVSDLGSRAHLSDRIEVDGVPVLAQNKVAYALNKPLGVVSAMSDDRLPHLGDLCADIPYRLFHIGRLDVDSEGLLILTNDGDLAERISHPKNEISKTYQLEIGGHISMGERKHLLQGVLLADGISRLDALKIKAERAESSLIEVRIHSGKNRILRRMFQEIGHPVKRLIRTKIGRFSLGSLKPGEIRLLSFLDINQMLNE